MVLDGPRPIAHVAREVGIHDTTQGNWVKDYRGRHGDAAATDTGGGEYKSRRELQLERENRKLREENEFLKKPRRSQVVDATPEVEESLGGVAW
jgi:transposase-like protein